MKNKYVKVKEKRERLLSLQADEAIRLVNRCDAGMDAMLDAFRKDGFSEYAKQIWDSLPDGCEVKGEIALDWVWKMAREGHLEELGWEDLIYEDEEVTA